MPSLSDLIRSTPGKPAEVVKKLADSGVKVEINLVRQVQKNRRRQIRQVDHKHNPAYHARAYLLAGLTQAQIRRRMGEAITPGHLRKIAYELRKLEPRIAAISKTIFEKRPDLVLRAKPRLFEIAKDTRYKSPEEAAKQLIVWLDPIKMQPAEGKQTIRPKDWQRCKAKSE